MADRCWPYLRFTNSCSAYRGTVSWTFPLKCFMCIPYSDTSIYVHGRDHSRTWWRPCAQVVATMNLQMRCIFVQKQSLWRHFQSCYAVRLRSTLPTSADRHYSLVFITLYRSRSAGQLISTKLLFMIMRIKTMSPCWKKQPPRKGVAGKSSQSLVAKRLTITAFHEEKSPAMMCWRASPTSQR